MRIGWHEDGCVVGRGGAQEAEFQQQARRSDATRVSEDKSRREAEEEEEEEKEAAAPQNPAERFG